MLIRALDKHRWFAPVALALTFGVLYLSTPTWDYHADGVAYAFNIEHVYRSGRLYTRLIHQNHLLYSVFGYFAYGAALLFSDDVRALRVLQCCSAVFGALGVFATYQLARSYLQSAASGLLTAACLGVLAGWWRTSTDADVYIVSATLVVSAAAIAARLPKLWPVGALVMATSMLTHQLAALGLLAVAFVVFSHSAGGLKQRVFKSAGFCFVSCTVTVFVYSMCATWGGYASTPAEVVLWAISNQGDFHFVLDPVANLAPAFKANVRLVVAWDLGLFQRTAGAVEYTALAMSGVCLIVSTWLGFNLVTNRQGEWRLQLPPGLAMLCLLWTAPFLMFLLVWEPYLTVYRVFYAPIVVIAIIGIVESVPGGGANLQRTYHALGGTVVLGLMLANFALSVRPGMDTTANPLVFQALSKTSQWSDGGTVILANPNVADTVALYFNPQMRWRRVAEDPKVIDATIREVALAGDRVWLNAEVFQSASKEVRDLSDGSEISIVGLGNSAVFTEVRLSKQATPAPDE